MTLSRLLDSSDTLVLPSVYDGISALAAREAGFSAVYVGSYATGATKYGVPDVGYISVEDMADQVRRISAIVEVPVIVDGEGGWGSALHVARSIKVLERAGAAAVHLEDHDFGKHITTSPRCLPLAQAVDKMKAAVDARESDEFLIIGRTDAAGIEGSEAAVDRLLAYQEAGVDALLITDLLDEAAEARLIAQATVPLISLYLPGRAVEDLGRRGYSAVVFYATTQIAARNAIREVFEDLKAGVSAVELAGRWDDGDERVGDLDDFLGIEHARQAAIRYGLLDLKTDTMK